MEPSANVERALAHAKPVLRGVIHQGAAFLVAGIGLWAFVAAGSPLQRWAVGLYVVAAVGMLALSAGLHWQRRGPRATERWVRLDHTGIYVMIASGETSVSLLGLAPPWREGLIVAAWVLAAVGIVVEWLPRATPRGFAHGMSLFNGWTAVLVAWRLWLQPGAGPDAVAWLAAGGIVYTVGAVIVAVGKPDPWPRVFGYHEVWHVLVVVALLVHLWLVAGVLA